MSIPGAVSINEYSTESADSSECSVDSCRNPLWAISNPGSCDVVPTLTGVRVEPESISIVAGRRGHIRIVAEFSNGSEADVTESGMLVSGDESTAEVASSSGGVVRGVVAGETWVDGVYQGYMARSTVTVLASTDVASVDWDVVFVLDLSVENLQISSKSLPANQSRFLRQYSWSYLLSPGIYWRAFRAIGDGISIDVFDDLVKQAQLSLSLHNEWDDDAGEDRFALVVTGDGNPYTYRTWTDTYADALFPYAYSDCALGDAMERAQTLLASARTASRKLVVVVTAGGETSCSPPAKTVATAIKTAGNKVAVITPLDSVGRTGTTIYSACSYPQTAYANLQEMASPGCFFGGRTWATMSSAFSRVLDDAF